MSINIFQFLKQGTTLSHSSLEKNKLLETQIMPKVRTPNALFMSSGKFQQTNLDQQSNKNHKYIKLDETQMKNQHLRKIHRAAELRKKYKIKVEGTDLPLLCPTFQEIGERYQIDQALLKGAAMLGVEKPTSVQMQAIPALLQDRNILVTAPTGTGKTLSYLLPILQGLLKVLDQSHSLKCVIIAPQQQLSTQIITQIQCLTSFVNESVDNRRIIYKCLTQLSEEQVIKITNRKNIGIDLLVVTPQNFLNLYDNQLTKKGSIFKHLKYVILDECDKYFEESFLQQIRKVLEIFASVKPKPIYGLFSATIQHPVEELLKTELLDDALRIQVGGKNKTLVNIDQSIQYCTNQYGKLLELKNMIGEGKFVPPALIFVQQKLRAKQLLFQLKKIFKNGPGGLDLSRKIEVLTSQKSKDERKDILQKYEKGHTLILITTDIVARGIDFNNVNIVINYDFPNSMLTYIHRVGRTGRAERAGKAVTFFTEEDKPIVKSLANLLKASGCKVPQWMLDLPNVDKQLRKKLQKFPTKRLPVGIAQGRDKNFGKELLKMQKVWKNKRDREIEKDKKKEAKDGAQENEWIQA